MVSNTHTDHKDLSAGMVHMDPKVFKIIDF